MPKAKSKATKTNRQRQSQSKTWLAASIFVLIASGISLALALAAIIHDNSQSRSPVHISLGGMPYKITDDGKAVRRHTPALTNLKQFLRQDGQKNIDLGCDSVYYSVMRWTPDDSQVLLSYGCGYPGSRIFAVRSGDDWKLLSPTNQFDNIGIPKCDYVAKHDISQRLAPVCFRDHHYEVR